jgi:hypothetical protein
MADLEARGVRLLAVGKTLRVDAPRGVLTATDREALVAHKPAVLATLRAEAEAPVPSGACGLCGGVLAWVEHWPSAGEARWLCPRCSSFPAPTLAAVFAKLRPQERDRLEAEGAQGDGLARAALSELRGEGRSA